MRSIFLLIASFILIIIARLHYEQYLAGNVDLLGMLFYGLAGIGLFGLAKIIRQKGQSQNCMY